MGKTTVCAVCGTRVSSRRIEDEFMDVCPVCLARAVRPWVGKPHRKKKRIRKAKRRP